MAGCAAERGETRHEKTATKNCYEKTATKIYSTVMARPVVAAARRPSLSPFLMVQFRRRTRERESGPRKIHVINNKNFVSAESPVSCDVGKRYLSSKIARIVSTIKVRRQNKHLPVRKSKNKEFIRHEVK